GTRPWASTNAVSTIGSQNETWLTTSRHPPEGRLEPPRQPSRVNEARNGQITSMNRPNQKPRPRRGNRAVAISRSRSVSGGTGACLSTGTSRAWTTTGAECERTGTLQRSGSYGRHPAQGAPPGG